MAQIFPVTCDSGGVRDTCAIHSREERDVVLWFRFCLNIEFGFIVKT